MKNTGDHIETLILKQMRQEASAAELAELQEWLDSAPGNREEYETLRNLWEASLPVLQTRSFDTATAWQKVRQRVLADVGPAATVKPGNRVTWRPWMAAAAILVLVTTAGWWFFGQRSRIANTSIVAAEGNRSIVLPDGSRVDLRKGSTLAYAGSFSGERVVELKGEAYFEVEHNAAKPFMVRTSRTVVEELGTSFVVKEEGGTVKLIVTSGKVKWTDRVLPLRSILLTAGERATLAADGFTRDRQSDPNFLSWKTKALVFNGTPLDVVLGDLQDLYQIPIGISPYLRSEAGSIHITAKFEHTEQIKDILEEIRLMAGLQIQQEKDTLFFFRK